MSGRDGDRARELEGRAVAQALIDGLRGVQAGQEALLAALGRLDALQPDLRALNHNLVELTRRLDAVLSRSSVAGELANAAVDRFLGPQRPAAPRRSR